MTKTVLVTSAAGGTQGRTGRHVAEMLLERGVRVRAFVRQIDERSDRLKSQGAEIVVGDFLDARSVEQAVRGVSSIYFAYPVQDGLADATAAMALAARKHGISRLVNLVMYRSSIDAPTPTTSSNPCCQFAAFCRALLSFVSSKNASRPMSFMCPKTGSSPKTGANILSTQFGAFSKSGV